MKDVLSVTSPTPPPGVPSYDIFDLSVRARIGQQLEISGGVNNLFDKQPPVVGGIQSQTNPTLYDVIGRAFFLGARFQL
jgi:outer membrane receptor protein involved in Fe transport